MSRALRLLATSSVAVVTAALLPLSVAPATAAATATATAAPAAPAPAPRAGNGVSVGDTAVTSSSYVPVGRPAARATTWPVGGGRADLSQHTMPATGAPAQQLASAKMRFYRARGGVMEAAVTLGAAPDASTPSTVLLAFGTLTSEGCLSPAGGNIVFTSTRTVNSNNPVYQGRVIKVRPFRFAAAARARWNCAFAQTRTDATTAGTAYDELAADVALFRQKPILSIRISDRNISSQAFTTIPVVITNSAATVATAANTRLGITARGLSYRFNPDVGSIRPGASRRGSIQLKYTTRYTGYFVITVRSGDYVQRVKYTVTPVRD